MSNPVKWTEHRLAKDAKISKDLFTAERDSLTDAWERHVTDSRVKFDKLFAILSDLNPKKAIKSASYAEVFSSNISDALRYLAGPPISDDDLAVISGIKSKSAKVIAKDPDAVAEIVDVIFRILDHYRFPWVQAKRAPTAAERDAALVASSVLLAAQKIATERRNTGKTNQESSVKDYLKSIGFSEVPTAAIDTIVSGPQNNQFCGECQLGTRKADIVVRLFDTRLLAIECKVSNSEINSVKRLNNDAAAKAETWRKAFGETQVVTAAMLSGVFKVLNLQQAQTSGLAIFWAHSLPELGAFIESTKKKKK
jgi:hypothetical protein